jgi:hypothetical protein
VHPAVTFQMKVVYQFRPRLERFRVLVASCGQFSSITVVHQAADENSNSSSIESGSRYLGSICLKRVYRKLHLTDNRAIWNWT